MNGHLTDEQFGDLLAGQVADAAAQAHLATCTQCRHELAEVQSATADFNAVSMAWALAEAPRQVHTPSRLLLLLGGRPSWQIGFAATAAVCLVALGLGLPTGHAHSSPGAQAAAEAPSTAELAQDDRLLQSINNELRYDPNAAFPVSELRSAARHQPHQAAARISH
ncbi:MAG: hypothetical protein ACRYFU_17405 [Janthinobacterium lividum]